MTVTVLQYITHKTPLNHLFIQQTHPFHAISCSCGWNLVLFSGAYQSHPMVLGALDMVNGRQVRPPIEDALMNATLAYSIDGWEWVRGRALYGCGVGV